MAKKSGNKTGTGVLIVVITAAVLASLVLIICIAFSGGSADPIPVANPVTKKVTREVTKKAAETIIQKETGTDLTLNEIKEEMSEEDAEDLDSIVNKYADEGILSDAIEIYGANGGDFKATADSLKDKISDEDISRIYELYRKYGDELVGK